MQGVVAVCMTIRGELEGWIAAKSLLLMLEQGQGAFLLMCGVYERQKPGERWYQYIEQGARSRLMEVVQVVVDDDVQGYMDAGWCKCERGKGRDG